MDDIKLIGVYSADVDALQAGINALRHQLIASDPAGSFNKHMEYMREHSIISQRNARYESLLRQVIPCLAMSTNTTAQTYIRHIIEALPEGTIE